jgi:uncharacterized protein DUF1706
MGAKQELLQDTETAFTELRQAVTGLPDGQMGTKWLGTWGVREILIHVSGWHREMIPALERIGRGEPPHPAGVSYDDFNAWNARFVDAKAGAKPAEVLAELDASHKSFVAAAGALPEPHLAAGGAARDLVDGVGAAHYREHAEQIRTWRKETGA